MTTNDKRTIPLCVADLDAAEERAVLDVLRSGWLAPGQYNKDFEQKFAEYLGVKHAIALNSCTSALHLAVEASDITGEVIVPSFTFVASANAIITGGATPVFADIREDTRALDPQRVVEKITPKTQAIMAVHYGGQAADIAELMDICDRYSLTFIEDSAETIGGLYNGKMAGSFGIGCFSFFPTKNITTAEGGMLTTNDDELAHRVRALSGHGITKSTLQRQESARPWHRAASMYGYNFRLSNLQAALGSMQMDKLPRMNLQRQEAGEYLTKQLEAIEGITPPPVIPGRTHVYQTYSAMLDNTVDRTALLAYLNEQGIGASVHFDPPVHLQPAYQTGAFDVRNLPVTEDVASRIISLPMYPSIGKENLDYIVAHVQRGIARQR